MLRSTILVNRVMCGIRPLKVYQPLRVSSNLRFFSSSSSYDTNKPSKPSKPSVGLTKTISECERENQKLQTRQDIKSDDLSQKQHGTSDKPSSISNSPQPICPIEEKKTYTRQIIGGLIFTAISLISLYFFLNKESKKPTEPKSKKVEKKVSVLKHPCNSNEIPSSVPYLLIGGGTASFSAFRSIKSSDPRAQVLVVSNETHYPYMRPPLSKEMWFHKSSDASEKLVFKQWNGTERSLFYEPNDFYVPCKELISQGNGGVAVARGWTVTQLDLNEKIAYLEDGHAIKFEKCLIATGATPKNLPMFEDISDEIQEKILLFRNIYDYQQLDDVVNCGARNIAIVGGGFLGSELACALAQYGKSKNLKVHQIFRENGNMGKVLPEYLSHWTTNKVKNEGVNVIPNAEVKGVSLTGNQLELSLSNGTKVKADHVVVAVGVEPNTHLAQSSGLEVDPQLGGYLVNAELMARSNVWVAGDCTCFYDTKLGRRRIEHHDHAVVSGRLAGENMTGAGKPYTHQSMFWSDLGPDVGYEAIGIVDSSLPTVGVFAKATAEDTPKAVVSATDEGDRSITEQNAEPVPPAKGNPSAPKNGEDYCKGVIFYLRNDVVVGIVLWNVFNRMSIARQVLRDEKKYNDLNEVAKLFNIHED